MTIQVIWIVAVFILNVISESYEKVMQKMVAQGYKVKVEMICDRELNLLPQVPDP